MTKRTIGALALLCIASPALAQSAPPTFQADPDIYKLVFENDNFRVIAATHPKGVRDKLHGHPLPFVVYFLTDCTLTHYSANGTTRVDTNKAGGVAAFPGGSSHSVENTGPADCREMFVERK
jgi:hypothetical protein